MVKIELSTLKKVKKLLKTETKLPKLHPSFLKSKHTHNFSVSLIIDQLSLHRPVDYYDTETELQLLLTRRKSGPKRENPSLPLQKASLCLLLSTSPYQIRARRSKSEINNTEIDEQLPFLIIITDLFQLG